MTSLPPVHTQSDLLAVWRQLMEPLGFGGSSVWMLRIQPDRAVVPQVVEIAEVEGPPEPDLTESFAEVLRLLDQDDPWHAYAFLRSRPGTGTADHTDRAWAAFLYDAGRVAGVGVEVVHLATDADVVPLPLDEIGLGRTA